MTATIRRHKGEAAGGLSGQHASSEGGVYEAVAGALRRLHLQRWGVVGAQLLMLLVAQPGPCGRPGRQGRRILDDVCGLDSDHLVYRDARGDRDLAASVQRLQPGGPLGQCLARVTAA